MAYRKEIAVCLLFLSMRKSVLTSISAIGQVAPGPMVIASIAIRPAKVPLIGFSSGMTKS